MKKILILILIIAPILCFGQRKLMVMKSNSYSIDKGGLTKDYTRKTKIVLYDDMIKMRYADRLISEKIPLKDVTFDIDGYFVAQVNKKTKHSRCVILTTDIEKYLTIEYKNRIKIYKIK